jgi:hypothetical protein
MDLKSVAEYNFAIHKIFSKLCFFDQLVNGTEKIEKTLSTFLPTNRLSQQQCCYHNNADILTRYAMYSRQKKT